MPLAATDGSNSDRCGRCLSGEGAVSLPTGVPQHPDEVEPTAGASVRAGARARPPAAPLRPMRLSVPCRLAAPFAAARLRRKHGCFVGAGFAAHLVAPVLPSTSPRLLLGIGLCHICYRAKRLPRRNDPSRQVTSWSFVTAAASPGGDPRATARPGIPRQARAGSLSYGLIRDAQEQRAALALCGVAWDSRHRRPSRLHGANSGGSPVAKSLACLRDLRASAPARSVTCV